MVLHFHNLTKNFDNNHEIYFQYLIFIEIKLISLPFGPSSPVGAFVANECNSSAKSHLLKSTFQHFNSTMSIIL